MTNQGPATPGTAARDPLEDRCLHCGRGPLECEVLLARKAGLSGLSVHDRLGCAEATARRLKAENASLLESLRAAEEAIRLRDANDNGLFMEAFRARERAREAEQNYAGAKELIEAGKTDYRSLLAQARAAEQRAEAAEKADSVKTREINILTKEVRAAEQRNTELEGALRKIADLWDGPLDSPDALNRARDIARAALHDEERRQREEK